MTKKDVDRFNVIQNKIPIKTVVERDNNGRILEVMEKPKLKQIDASVHASGCHMFQDNPEENHYDHYQGGQKWIERQTAKKNLEFPYEIKDNILICKILPDRFVIVC